MVVHLYKSVCFSENKTIVKCFRDTGVALHVTSILLPPSKDAVSPIYLSLVFALSTSC